MELKYTKITDCGYIPNSDDWEEYGDEFVYEPEYNEEIEAFGKILNERYFSDLELSEEQKLKLEKDISFFVSELSTDELISLEKDFEDELTEYFKKKAFEVFD